MDTVKLQVMERELTGNGPARRLRAEGRLPGVVYSRGNDPKAVSVSLEDLVTAMREHGHNVILELEMGEAAKAAKGKKAGLHYAIVKELQRHPTKRHLLHVDLHEVDLAVEIEASVAIEAVGTAPGVGDGGILDWELREVTVRALPSGLPESVELDISELQVGQNLTVEALKAPAGAEIVDDPGLVVVTLVAPRGEQEAGIEVAEPEIIGEVKSEE